MRLSDFLRGIGRPVVYYPSLNPITGGVTATIFLLTFVQWHGTQHDPQGWIYKTQGEIERETGLSRYEQETARKQLRTRDLLQEKRRGVPARLHYRVQLDHLNTAWERNAAIKNGGNPQTGMGETDEQAWGEAADYLRVHDPRETQDKEAQSATNVWDELAKLHIPNVAAYIRVTGRGPFNDPVATLALARKKRAEQGKTTP